MKTEPIPMTSCFVILARHPMLGPEKLPLPFKHDPVVPFDDLPE
jgi:hypothetical protein